MSSGLILFGTATGIGDAQATTDSGLFDERTASAASRSPHAEGQAPASYDPSDPPATTAQPGAAASAADSSVSQAVHPVQAEGTGTPHTATTQKAGPSIPHAADTQPPAATARPASATAADSSVSHVLHPVEAEGGGNAEHHAGTVRPTGATSDASVSHAMHPVEAAGTSTSASHAAASGPVGANTVTPAATQKDASGLPKDEARTEQHLPNTPVSLFFPLHSAQTFPFATRSDGSRIYPFAPVDSLPTEGTAACYPVTADAIFGESVLIQAPDARTQSRTASLVADPFFQGFVLLLAAAYALLLHFNPSDAGSLLRRISRDRTSAQRLQEDPGSSGFARFLRLTSAIGILFVGVAAVKCLDLLLAGSSSVPLFDGPAPLTALAAMAAFAALLLYQRTALGAAGSLTRSTSLTTRILLLKRTYFALAIVLTAPLLLLSALCPAGTGNVWLLLVVISLAVTAVLYLQETLHLFLAKKISILHWFLYLCSVEIFPISLLWLLAAR